MTEVIHALRQRTGVPTRSNVAPSPKPVVDVPRDVNAMSPEPHTIRDHAPAGFSAATAEPARSLHVTPAAGRVAAVDHIKAAAILAVIANHALPFAMVAHGVPWQEALRWLVAFHVPSFLIVSGFLYAPGGLRDGAVVRRRLGRVLVPYLVASAAMQLFGFSRARSPSEVVFQLATGGSLPIYYYVYVLTLSIVATAVLARLGGERLLRVVCACVWLYVVAEALFPEALLISKSVYWGMRNPPYYYAFFLLGWVAAGSWPAIQRCLTQAPRAVRAACIAAAALCATAPVVGLPGPVQGLFRGLYTVAVVTFIAATPGNTLPARLLAFLSRATYGLFLYHLPFMRVLAPAVAGWAPLPRTVVLFASGLAGGALVCFAGTRLLGAPAALVVGVTPGPDPRSQ
jgi:peptidoglycan/LPS O-acetylase OafA/YrhL